MPQFACGICTTNIDMAVNMLKKLNYKGPLALGTDDTKLEPALQVYQDSTCTWLVIGNVGNPIVACHSPEQHTTNISDDSEAMDFDISKFLQSLTIEKADKLRLIVLIVPMLKVYNSKSVSHKSISN